MASGAGVVLAISGCGSDSGSATADDAPPQSAPSAEQIDANWVAVGTYLDDSAVDGGALLVSADGVDWEVNKEQGTSMNGVASDGAGTFVAVGENDDDVFIMTGNPTDGWDSQNISELDRIGGVAYHAGVWVAVGRGTDGHTGLLVSNDATTWELRDVDDMTPNAWLSGVTYGGDKWVAWGEDDENTEQVIATSADGSFWTFAGSGDYDLINVAYANGMWAATGDDGLLVSNDGTSWMLSNAFTTGSCWGLAASSTGFAASCSDDGLFTSADAMDWTTQASPESTSVSDLSSDGTRWVGTGNKGTARVAVTSENGTEWLAGGSFPDRWFCDEVIAAA